MKILIFAFLLMLSVRIFSRAQSVCDEVLQNIPCSLDGRPQRCITEKYGQIILITVKTYNSYCSCLPLSHHQGRKCQKAYVTDRSVFIESCVQLFDRCVDPLTTRTETQKGITQGSVDQSPTNTQTTIMITSPIPRPLTPASTAARTMLLATTMPTDTKTSLQFKFSESSISSIPITSRQEGGVSSDRIDVATMAGTILATLAVVVSVGIGILIASSRRVCNKVSPLCGRGRWRDNKEQQGEESIKEN